MADGDGASVGPHAEPALRHSYCSSCHPDPSDVVTLCSSRAHGANPAGAPGLTDPDCIVCIDLLSQDHRCLGMV